MVISIYKHIEYYIIIDRCISVINYKNSRERLGFEFPTCTQRCYLIFDRKHFLMSPWYGHNQTMKSYMKSSPKTFQYVAWRATCHALSRRITLPVPNQLKSFPYIVFLTVRYSSNDFFSANPKYKQDRSCSIVSMFPCSNLLTDLRHHESRPIYKNL